MADAQSAPDSSSTVVTEANNVTPGATMETEAIEVTPVAPAVTVATDVIPDAAAVTVADDVVPDATPVPAVNGEAKVEPSESAAAEPVEETTKSSEVAVPTEANGATPVREDERKLFIGGMSSETTENDLKEYFSKFGEVENINVKLDPNTGRSRGFAFVIFKTVESVQKALAVSEHTISSKQVEVNRAKARPGKVFVGGLSPDVPEEEIREHFGKFGKILELELPFDKVRNQRKGFCFVTYEYGDCVKEVLKNPKQIIGDKEVEIKKATPRADMFGGGRGGMYGAPRGRGGAFPARGGRGRGGGGGGWGAQEWGGGYGGGYGGYGASAAGGGGYYEGGYGYQAGNAGGYGGGYGGGNYASQGQYGGQKPRGEGRGGQRYMPYNRQ